MSRNSVSLSKKPVRSPSGKRYTYWVLRWYCTDGRRPSLTLGRVDQLSKRQAEKLRRDKESELLSKPGRRDAARAPELEVFLDQYLTSRLSELAEGTLALHRHTKRCLVAYFGAYRRLDSVTRLDARGFKTALANGELVEVMRKNRTPSPATVDQHIRHARTMFNHALADDLILFNPFDRLASTKHVPGDWHYVAMDEFAKLYAAAGSPAWRLLLVLARFAALRRGEALHLRWNDVDWQASRLRVVSHGKWKVKDKDSRIVPICPELHAILLTSFDGAQEGQRYVIPPGSLNVKNLWRDFGVVAKRAEVERYAKPIHTLRKSCLTDWAGKYPMHVVKAWAGHSDVRTTDEFYLQVPDSEYERAGKDGFTPVAPQLWTQLASNGTDMAKKENAEDAQVLEQQGLSETAGERIRTADVQLGKLAFYH